jgi:hypothetical protein
MSRVGGIVTSVRPGDRWMQGDRRNKAKSERIKERDQLEDHDIHGMYCKNVKFR